MSYVLPIRPQVLFQLVDELAPKCADCGSPITTVCLEKCCYHDPVFCRYCDDQHFLHRINDIKMLFVHPKHYRPDTQCMQDLTNLLVLFQPKNRGFSGGLRKSETKMRLCSHVLQDVARARKRLHMSRWHTTLITILKNYSNKELSLERARGKFNLMLININLYMDDPKLQKQCKDKNCLRKSSENCLEANAIDANELISSINSYQINNISTFLMGFPFDKFISEWPLVDQELINARHRSRCLRSSDVERTPFKGSRLIISLTKQHQTAPPILNVKHMPNLVELHTEAELVEYPQVKSLGIRLRNPPKKQLITTLPDCLQLLRLHVDDPGYTLNGQGIDTYYTPIIDKIIELIGKNLKVFYLSLPRMLISQIVRLIRASINSQVRNFCLHVSKRNEGWYPFFDDLLYASHLQPHTIKFMNWIYHRTFFQIRAIQRNKVMRLIPQIFVEGILEASVSKVQIGIDQRTWRYQKPESL